jgi:hypothetical protein
MFGSAAKVLASALKGVSSSSSSRDRFSRIVLGAAPVGVMLSQISAYRLNTELGRLAAPSSRATARVQPMNPAMGTRRSLESRKRAVANPMYRPLPSTGQLPFVYGDPLANQLDGFFLIGFVRKEIPHDSRLSLGIETRDPDVPSCCHSWHYAPELSWVNGWQLVNSSAVVSSPSWHQRRPRELSSRRVACVAMQQFVQQREGKACHRDAQRCRIAPGVCQQCAAPKTSVSPTVASCVARSVRKREQRDAYK